MRRKHKLHYMVTDDPHGHRDYEDLLWWCAGRWLRESELPMKTAHSHANCRQMRTALRHARALRDAGGQPRIARRVFGRKRKWQNFHLPSQK